MSEYSKKYKKEESVKKLMRRKGKNSKRKGGPGKGTKKGQMRT
jgi:hypothetical protein